MLVQLVWIMWTLLPSISSVGAMDSTSTIVVHHHGRLMTSSVDVGRMVQSKRPSPVRNRPLTPTPAVPKCSTQTFENCLAMMQQITENSSLAFPTNTRDLDITCRKLKDGDYCAEKYIRFCAGDRQRLLYQDIVQGSKNMIRHLCQQGDTQKLYLEYAACFKDISLSETKCSKVLDRFQEASKLLSTGTGTTSSDENLKQFCCAYRDSVNCQLYNVRKYCGQRGLEFFERYMAEMTNSVINEHCVGYTYSDKCQAYEEKEKEEDNGDIRIKYRSNNKSRLKNSKPSMASSSFESNSSFSFPSHYCAWILLLMAISWID